MHTCIALSTHLHLLQEWPLKSKLDPTIYGPAESAITDEMTNQEIGGIMTVEQVQDNAYSPLPYIMNEFVPKIFVSVSCRH